MNDSEAASPAQQIFGFSKGYRRYVLTLLTLVYVFSYIDRQIFWTLLPRIQEDFNLDDTMLGLLSGVTFALFYAGLGVPIARLADRFNRRNIIAVSITLWSVMTVACGFASNVLSLFFTRIGVGVGEAGSSPPSHSIISDYYAGKERSGALGILSSAITIGVFIGFAFGGWGGEHLGWQTTLIIVGAPGVLVGLLVWLTLREPPRGHSDGLTQDADTVSMRQTLRYLLSSPTFRFNALSGATQGYVGYGLMSWASSYFERTYGLGGTEIGIKLGIVTLCGGLLGALPVSFLADHLAKRDLRWYPRVAAIGMCLGAACIGATYFTRDPNMAFIIFGFAAAGLNSATAPMFTIAQGIAPVRMRASSTALLFLSINLLGMGLGPFVIGWVSDLLVLTAGYTREEALRTALLPMLTTVALICAFLFMGAARRIHRDFVTPHPGHKMELAR